MDLKRRLGILHFKEKELEAIIIVTLLIGLTLGFNDKRSTLKIDEYWMKNFFLCTIATFIALLTRIIIQKFIGFKLGFETEFKSNPYGLLLGIFTTFIFNGYAYLFVPGGIRLKEKPEMHLGNSPYLKVRQKYSLVPIGGWIATLSLLILSKFLLELFPQTLFLQKVTLVNALFLVYFFLPLPPESDAFYIAFWSRTSYIFFLSFSIAIAFSILYLPLLASLLLSLAIGGYASYWFYTKWEK